MWVKSFQLKSYLLIRSWKTLIRIYSWFYWHQGWIFRICTHLDNRLMLICPSGKQSKVFVCCLRCCWSWNLVFPFSKSLCSSILQAPYRFCPRNRLSNQTPGSIHQSIRCRSVHSFWCNSDWAFLPYSAIWTISLQSPNRWYQYSLLEITRTTYHYWCWNPKSHLKTNLFWSRLSHCSRLWHIF